MAHELSQRENGFVEMAFTALRNQIWHGLGQELLENATLEEWKVQAGMDWEIFESAVTYNAYGETLTFPDKKALFRSDTKAPLSIVSPGYKIVQPTEVLEFFRDLIENNGMRLSTAGVLFGGKRFWALADMNKDDYIIDGDRILGKLLLTTSADGTLATIGQFVSERVVCNNTLRIALNENTSNLVRVTHKSDWDANQVKIDLGLVDASWSSFITNMRKLANTPISAADTYQYFKDKFYSKELLAEQQTAQTIKKVNDLMGLTKYGAGSELDHGTAWGVVNAITNMYTHGNGRKQDPSRKFWNAYVESDKIKQEVVNDMLALAD